MIQVNAGRGRGIHSWRMDNPYLLLGGEAGVRRLAEAFYDAMSEFPEAASVRRMHAEDLGGIKQKLFEFLSGWLGGPQVYFQNHPGVCIMSVHARYAIGPAERDQWLLCMREALRRVDASPEVTAMLERPFVRFAEAMRNRQDSAVAADAVTSDAG